MEHVVALKDTHFKVLQEDAQKYSIQIELQGFIVLGFQDNRSHAAGKPKATNKRTL